MTQEQLRTAVAKQWSEKTVKMDWLGLESIIVDILHSNDPDFTDADRCMLLREAMDAWTRRGHFTGCY